ncbi:MAG: class I SAM-dependent methyltransferase [Treponema sp.]
MKKRARKSGVSCFRIYDRDIPEVPVSLDLYEFLPENVRTAAQCAAFIAEQNAKIAANDAETERDAALRRYFVLYLYERPYEKPADEERDWLNLIAGAVSDVFGAERERVIVKTRQRQRGENQYARADAARTVEGLVQECGLLFAVNLSSYIDTGLFFDHRELRSVIRAESAGKRVLNLFCYTGSFSAYAAAGGAAFVESVDLSNTYLSRAQANMAANGFSGGNYVFTRADVTEFLSARATDVQGGRAAPFDIIILDPPTFSNSKMTENVLDINKSWSALVNGCIKLLGSGGILYFSTNSRRLQFDGTKIDSSCTAEDITERTIPFDYAGMKPHRCWRIEKR